jgi:hypothetical protein
MENNRKIKRSFTILFVFPKLRVMENNRKSKDNGLAILFIFPKLDDVAGGQESEAVIVPSQGGDAAVRLEGGRLHPPVVQAALAAGRDRSLVVCK